MVGSLLLGMAVSLASACALRSTQSPEAAELVVRRTAIASGRVWSRTDVGSMDLRRGPGGRHAPPPEALLDCTYRPDRLGGNTPKFLCTLSSGETVKVKYGRDNGEVFAEVAASRLLWALGFGADRVYPVRVRCRGCPDERGLAATTSDVRLFDVATIERRRPGHAPGAAGDGWSWQELDDVDPARGGASRAERDALTLLAVMLQHTDSKYDQQRLVCDGRPTRGQPCPRPFMFIDDAGRTFGVANALNRDGPSSVNLEAWSGARIWADPSGCRANMPRSLTGTLDNPVISEEGRQFLSRLLHRLTDRQLQQLFTVARFPARVGATGPEQSRLVDGWVRAFKDKIEQIDARTCPAGVAVKRP